MASKEEKSLYDTLNEDRTGVPPAEETFSLEEILAEYGGGRERKILEDVERQVAQELGESAPAGEPSQPAQVPSEQDTAEEPGISVSAVNKHIVKGLRTLREKLKGK